MPILSPGDTIGVISPSGMPDMAALSAGMETMRKMGYVVKAGENIGASWQPVENKGYKYAGTPAQRAADLHAMYSDPSVKLIVAARGGYGADDVVPLLDSKLIRANPKPLMGYSDVTNLLNWVAESCGAPAWHGPMVARDFAWPGGGDTRSFLASAANDHVWQLGAADGLVQVLPGHARGTLRGGCLKVLERAFNVRSFSGYTDTQRLNFLQKLDGPTILFLEDINEEPRDTHANWMHLKSRIDFAQVKGVIFGYMLVAHRRPQDFIQVIREMFAGDGIPVAFGLRSGHLDQDLTQSGKVPAHVQANITLPFGGTVELLCNESATLHMYPTGGAP